MSAGAVLAGVGVLMVLVAYVARPFRETARDETLDRLVEAWVAQVEEEQGVLQQSAGTDQGARAGGHQKRSGSPTDGGVKTCSHCGRRVSEDDRYCSGCGYRLPRGSA